MITSYFKPTTRSNNSIQASQHSKLKLRRKRKHGNYEDEAQSKTSEDKKNDARNDAGKEKNGKLKDNSGDHLAGKSIKKDDDVNELMKEEKDNTADGLEEESIRDDGNLKEKSYTIGTKISKLFDGTAYEGEIVSFNPQNSWYRIKYDDGDEEEMDDEDVSKHILISGSIHTNKKKEKNNNAEIKTEQVLKRKKTLPSITPETSESDEDVAEKNSAVVKNYSIFNQRAVRTRTKVDYSAKVYDDMDFGDGNSLSSETKEVTSKRKKGTGNGGPSRVKKAKKATVGRKKADDESDASIESASSEDMDFDESEEDVGGKTKKKGRAATKKKSTSKTVSKIKPVAANGKEKKKMADSFKPMDAPLFCKLSLDEIAKQKEYLDPCGMEATDDIIDRLVGDQVDKIGSLLERALTNVDEKNIGSSNHPLQLGTACSGTDAPSLAMTLVQEQMEIRGLLSASKPNASGPSNSPLFHFEHGFSCEVDPFKQAYLARNFDSVLYPDICKLTDDEPRDVYGQVENIPPFNLFVAGTSCKNFSMQNSTKRLDIEDKGCSGETFLAAVEVLFKKKPEFAIFENVVGAPWAKMQEYITGAIKLGECDSKKAIKEIKDKKKELGFTLDKDKNIIVDDVPAVYGVRCGAVVSGFTKPKSKNLHKIEWPTCTGKNKKNKCTLADLIKKNNISKKEDTLVFETECTYCTHITKVDTKNYGLPQTRNRTYMFVWRPDNDDAHDDLGFYWEAIVKHLESPVRHSLHSFILNVDHEIIRVFREALNGPAGRQTKRGAFLEPDFWSSADANLPHNQNVRKVLGLKDRARFITSWGAFGKKQIPPHYWLEYMNCNNQRIIDLIDILHASAARDAESHDSSFSSFYWNVSQNASKEKHRTACPGIAGCVTPGGDFFLPEEGRPLLGCEKLLVQGIPYFRLALGNETEVQLGDLAGNAMSLTVVCATMLAAVTCKQLRREVSGSNISDIKNALVNKAATKTRKPSIPTKGIIDQRQLSMSHTSLTSASDFFVKLASLATAAIKSSIWCTCETSGSNSLTSKFLQCKVCRVSCCRNCCGSTAGYQLKTHDTEDIEISPEEHNLGNFLNKLREVVPPSLVFNQNGIKEIASIDNDIHRASVLSNYEFCLYRIKRDRKKWLICYMARENNNVGEAVGEFRITVGELKREEVKSRKDKRVDIGIMGELTSFKPAQTEPRVYGRLEPCAFFTLGQNEVFSSSNWKVKTADNTVSLVVKGEGISDSHRAEVGLTEAACASLKATAKLSHNIKAFTAAKKRGEERRWIYPENWDKWPQTLTLNVPKEQNAAQAAAISGVYERARCRQTINHSCLWIKEATPENPPMYIIINPDANRTGPDVVVVSSSLDYKDVSSIVAVFPKFWEPCDALQSEKHQVNHVQLRNWTPLTKLECQVPASNIKVASPANTSNVLVSVSGLNDTEIAMLHRGNSSTDCGKSDEVEINLVRGQKAQQTVRIFNAICVVPILKFAAQNGLKYGVHPGAPWTKILPSETDVMFGHCQDTVPIRPTEEWYFDEERSAWQRRSEPGASRQYYLALQAAPKPFEVWMNRSEGILTVKYFPMVVAHQAAGQLIGGRGLGDLEKEITVSYRLMDLTQQNDPVIAAFKVSNCDSEDITKVPLKGKYELYTRQQKVVTKMLAIENGSTDYEELEMSEHEMPGSTRFSLIAKATRKAKIRGGVIADAIGAGKTVISIAIIIKGLEEAKKSRQLPSKSGATLVVVPPSLINQWRVEIDKFSTSLRVIKIFDFASLRTVSVKELVNADVVICPIDILESTGYLENMIKKSNLKKEVKEIPKLPQRSGQTEITAAKGVWIPATSQDPYAGSNNPRNQERRNVTAYYTFIYLKAIRQLRKVQFKPTDRGVPLEFFEWERVFVDEIHESLCTTKAELQLDEDKVFKEKNRRAGRELLGITEKDIRYRPLIFRKSIFGLTGTPLLDSSSRVIELASLMGNSYIIGLSSHWRKLERESCRDIFLHNYLEPKQSREVRKHIQTKCQKYLDVACCRNKTGEEMDGIELKEHIRTVQMTEEEKSLYLESQSGIASHLKSLSITPADFDPSAGHDITKFLKQNAKFSSRGNELVSICKEILSTKGDECTKIIVFTDGRIGAGDIARQFLCSDDAGIGCTWLDLEDSNEKKNEKISWYQTGDATLLDRERPRVLVLHFEHAAGLNLQTECHNLILFTPLYVGDGSSNSDPVSDASTELQAIGRVYRAGQTNQIVNVYRIEVQGPNGEECLDGQLIRRNTNEENVAMAVNAGE